MNLGAAIKSLEATTGSPLMLVKYSMESRQRNRSGSEGISESAFTPKETSYRLKQYMGVKSIIKGIDYLNDSNQIKKEAYCIWIRSASYLWISYEIRVMLPL
jgi:hypothetical protein